MAEVYEQKRKRFDEILSWPGVAYFKTLANNYFGRDELYLRMFDVVVSTKRTRFSVLCTKSRRFVNNAFKRRLFTR